MAMWLAERARPAFFAESMELRAAQDEQRALSVARALLTRLP